MTKQGFRTRLLPVLSSGTPLDENIAKYLLGISAGVNMQYKKFIVIQISNHESKSFHDPIKRNGTKSFKTISKNKGTKVNKLELFPTFVLCLLSLDLARSIIIQSVSRVIQYLNDY